MKNVLPKWRGLFFVALAVACLGIAARGEETKKLVTRSWNLCDYKTDLDGGLVVASDGLLLRQLPLRAPEACSSSSPQDWEITVLTDDISRCEDQPEPQGRSLDVDEMDGWLYLAPTSLCRHPGPMRFAPDR
jgi:hypothetical protein